MTDPLVTYALALPWTEKDDIHSVTYEGFDLAISHAADREFIACVSIGPWCCSETWDSLNSAKIALVEFVRHCGRAWNNA